MNASPLDSLAAVLISLGCPAGKTADMARMLDKRARQLSESKGCAYEAALGHLLGLMRQGWAAREGNVEPALRACS